MVGDEGISNPHSFKVGYKKALEFNKDKLFTLEDMIGFGRWIIANQEFENTSSWSNETAVYHLNKWKSIQQPKEIEVEMEMICPHPLDTYRCGLEFGCDGDGCNNPNQIPYLDKNGCLILRKI